MSLLDVLVIGAGPTGLVAASELCRYGLSIRLIDKLPERSLLSRALGLQARTLEILDELGCVADLIPRGIQLRGATLHSGTEPIASFSFDELDSRFPYALCLPQSETEGVLEELLHRRGGRIERGIELVSFTHGDSGVAATVKHADGHNECIEARWMIGCDGAHSMVRSGLMMEFPGEAFPESFLLADVSVAWELPRDRISTFFSPEGVLGCFPLPNGTWRLIANGEGEATLDTFQKLVDTRCGFPARLSDPGWMAQFRINTRQVAKYSVGRVFLAGDAAHIHSPIGGQGMNTGMQDAHNLAWKLAHVTKKLAPMSLLDSYHLERHKIGKQLLRGTDVATRVGMLKKSVARAIRDHAARYLSQLDVVQNRIARTVSEINLSYSGSPICDESRELIPRIFGDDEAEESATLSAQRKFAGGPRAGERAPDAEILDKNVPRRLSSLLGNGCHSLLLFDGRARTEAGYRTLSHIAAALEARHPEIVKVFTIVSGREPPGYTGPLGRVLLDPDGAAEDAYGATAECVYVIRPDLYIGHRCQPASVERVLEHFAKVLI
jgi:2-polyprenyl-6-methoxyphenol hydroxylase-like FAD-dependent oxidoreductase